MDLFYKYDLYLEMFFILNIMMHVTESLNCSVCCSKGSEPIFSDILYSFSEFPACSVVNPTPELFSFFVTKMSFVCERKGASGNSQGLYFIKIMIEDCSISLVK